jgi:hypothetical protein
VKTSLRLIFSAVAVSFITVAASGAPLPFLSHAKVQTGFVADAPQAGAVDYFFPVQPVAFRPE